MELESNFSNLPIEIIENVFKYLSIDDIKDASLVCNHWFISSQSPNIVARTKLVISSNNILIKNDPVTCSVLQNNCMRKYTSVIFKYLSLDKSDFLKKEIFLNLRETITELTLHSCPMKEETLLQLLETFPKLTKLRIFLINKIEFNCDNILVKYIDKLKTLYLRNSFSINENVFENIKNKISTIERFRLDILKHSDKCWIIKILEKLSISLKSLTLSCKYWDEDFLICLTELKNLHLDSLALNIDEVIQPKIFKNFTQSMATLINLSISQLPLQNNNLIDICTYMKNLKSLQLTRCNEITNDGLIEVEKLKKLEKLLIFECNNITDIGITNGIAKTRNETFKYICIEGNFSDVSLISIAKNLPNLRSLEVRSALHLNRRRSFVYLSEKSTNVIFQHLLLLRVLKLRSSRSICDKKIRILSESEKFNINRIKGLRILELDGFVSIPGTCSILEISQLIELETLSISRFDMPEDEIKNLVNNCRNLKTITLCECESISSDLINLIGTKLRRLKCLEIYQKNDINNKCIENINMKNKNLDIIFRQSR